MSIIREQNSFASNLLAKSSSQKTQTAHSISENRVLNVAVGGILSRLCVRRILVMR